jgi:hypothetical protein
MYRASGQSLSIVSAARRSLGFTRLHSKEQRACFPYVPFNATLEGRLNGMIGPAEEGQGIREPTHRCAVGVVSFISSSPGQAFLCGHRSHWLISRLPSFVAPAGPSCEADRLLADGSDREAVSGRCFQKEWTLGVRR